MNRSQWQLKKQKVKKRHFWTIIWNCSAQLHGLYGLGIRVQPERSPPQQHCLMRRAVT